MSVTEQRARELFEEADAIVMNSHFVYTKDDHGPHYINKDRIYLYTRLLDELCMGLAERFVNDNIDIVIAPAIGAISIKDGVARLLTRWRRDLVDVLAVYAEHDPKNQGEFVFNRGYDEVLPKKRALVVEDVVNTGGSAGGTVRAARKAGAIVVAVGSFANRGGVTASNLGVEKFEAMLNVNFVKYPPDNCPLCKEGVPINTKLGKGRKFLEAQQAARASQ